MLVSGRVSSIIAFPWDDHGDRNSAFSLSFPHLANLMQDGPLEIYTWGLQPL